MPTMKIKTFHFDNQAQRIDDYSFAFDYEGNLGISFNDVVNSLGIMCPRSRFIEFVTDLSK